MENQTMVVKLNKAGKVGNKEMIQAIKDNIGNPEIIAELAKQFPIEFPKAAKYLTFTMREAIRIATGSVVEVKYRNKFNKESLGKYIEVGPRGITRVQMVPAITSQIEDEEAITALFNDYPEVFAKSVLLLETDELKDKVEAITKVAIPRSQKREAKVKEEVVAPKFEYAENFNSKNNEKLAAAVKANEALVDGLSDEEKALVVLALKDTPMAKIAEAVGFTNDKVYGQLFRNKNSIFNKLTA